MSEENMESERKVSIGSGSRENLVKELRRMADELEGGASSTNWYVEANDSSQPGLNLEVNFETAEDPEWTEPVVDYD